MNPHEYVIVQTTTDTSEEADKLASSAIDQRLAACVQVSQVQSYYRWEGTVQHDPEFLLSFKTTSAVVQTITEYLAAHHSYDEPEVIVIPIVDGSSSYLQWITDSVA